MFSAIQRIELGEPEPQHEGISEPYIVFEISDSVSSENVLWFMMSGRERGVISPTEANESNLTETPWRLGLLNSKISLRVCQSTTTS